MEATVSPFAEWESFYVIVGSSAAALTGLQFVVIALVARRARQTTNYTPVVEDWLFHVVLPAAAYAVVTAAAYWLRLNAERALFAIGAAALLLLFVGIHNAWDTVTYIVLVAREQQPDRSK